MRRELALEYFQFKRYINPLLSFSPFEMVICVQNIKKINHMKRMGIELPSNKTPRKARTWP
jgi:hypothetical protein